MPTVPERLEFRIDERTDVVVRMAEVLRDRSGWMVFDPGFDSVDRPPTRPLGGLFSARGPDVPDASWVPGPARRGGGYEPTSIGLRHPAGPKVVDQLREVGCGVRDGWNVIQDHSRRGLVIQVPDDDLDAVLGWLLQAGTVLCEIPLDGWWRATIH